MIRFHVKYPESIDPEAVPAIERALGAAPAPPMHTDDAEEVYLQGTPAWDVSEAWLFYTTLFLKCWPLYAWVLEAGHFLVEF